MLQLTPTAGREMSARRVGVMRACRQCAIFAHGVARNAAGNVPPRRSDAIAARSNADDFFGFTHRKDAMAGFTA